MIREELLRALDSLVVKRDFANYVLSLLELEETWKSTDALTSIARYAQARCLLWHDRGRYVRTPFSMADEPPEDQPKANGPSETYSCATCGSTNVQVSLPGWYRPGSLEHIEVDYEASPLDYYCEECGESREINVTRTDNSRRQAQMKRPSYKDAVAWIAENDSAGDGNALDPQSVAELVTTLLIADLFGVEPARVGQDVVKHRRNRRRAADS